MRLSGQQYEQLVDALLSAFPSLSQLRQMVRFRLDQSLDEIALGDDLKEIGFKLVMAAEAEGWILKLVIAARESNPGNSKLLMFSQQLGLASSFPPGQELERIIKGTNSFLDVEQWRTRLGEIEAQVCRIEITLNGGASCSFGTGFLLGRDICITNYHVMEPVIVNQQAHNNSKNLKAAPHDVVFRFDYKRLPDGQTVNPGTEYRLAAENWLIDYSPMSLVDNFPEPKAELPNLEQLDYALIQLEGEPGNVPIGQHPEPGASKRGWISVPTQDYEFQRDSPLLIMQHPQGAPLKLAFDTNAIIGINVNKTRVTYKTNTMGGSSGSPCFNISWELVALHHAGDPNFSPTHKPEYNEGIPFSTILALLRERGHLHLLGR